MVEEVAQQPSRNRAVVTGGASGLGAALCRALVARGDEALSADLRRLGFTFVGPTTMWAMMQSLGVVNDHLVGCDFR